MKRQPRIIRRSLPLQTFDLDCFGHYPLARLIRLFIDVADAHADLLGIGARDLLSQSVTWVLSRLSLRMDGPIDATKPLDLETGLLPFSRLTSRRAIRATQGEERRTVAVVLTRWVAIDFKSRRPIAPERVAAPEEFDFLSEDEWPLPELCQRVIGKDVSLEPAGVHHICYSDLDLNRHFNTCAQVSTVLDALPLEQLEESPRQVDMHFIRESVQGERLRLLTATGEGGVYYVRLVPEANEEEPRFDFRITYK